ncbi:hypothetical protein QQP08_004556 [Theobroma cacao]|nr:hypothetical protein QQP08_004556 [Theobroma cacao]
MDGCCFEAPICPKYNMQQVNSKAKTIKWRLFESDEMLTSINKDLHAMHGRTNTDKVMRKLDQ